MSYGVHVHSPPGTCLHHSSPSQKNVSKSFHAGKTLVYSFKSRFLDLTEPYKLQNSAASFLSPDSKRKQKIGSGRVYKEGVQSHVDPRLQADSGFITSLQVKKEQERNEALVNSNIWEPETKAIVTDWSRLQAPKVPETPQQPPSICQLPLMLLIQ